MKYFNFVRQILFMASVRQLYSQSVVYGLSTVVPRLLNYLLVPLHTTVLTNPEQYGVITEMYAYISFILILLTFGLETGFFRFSSKFKNNESVYSTIFYFLIFTSSLFFLIISIFSFDISNFLGSFYKPIYITTLAGVVSIDAVLALPFAKLRNENKPFLFSSLKILGVVINVFCNILFYLIIPRNSLYTLFPNVDLLYFVFLSNLIQNIFVLILLLIFTKIPKLIFSPKLLKSILIYSLPLLIAGLSGTTNEAFDRIFIKYLYPIKDEALYQLGIYGANVKLAVFLVLFIQMYRFAAEPFFFKLQNESNNKEIFAKSFKYFLIFCFFITILITFNIPILKYFVGSNYRHNLYIVPILLIANSLFGIYFNLSFWFKLSDKTLYGLKYVGIGAFTTIISNVILIPLIGIYGAAVSRIISYTIMTLLCYIDGKRSGYISIDRNNLKLFLLFLLFISFISTVLLIYSKPLFSLIFANLFLILFIFFFLKKENIKILNLRKC